MNDFLATILVVASAGTWATIMVMLTAIVLATCGVALSWVILAEAPMYVQAIVGALIVSLAIFTTLH